MPATIPIACTLDQAALPDRARQLAELGRDLIEVRAHGAEASLRFQAARSADIDAFIAAESSCCAFFSFDKTESGDAVELAISAPAEGEWAVKGLVAGFVAGWGGLV
jgi:hypothetical protein